ncbi:hypothetical protein THAOC_19686 [Thalassiosira oceanica]|uniref:Uncharacterized protein n=1 Tax=Thalassiosira oceanica TaxID=159749 RepID=K0SGE0_THAOC|nr:hypothetical protein THAOC_19686 [Thalassiosira oceanica]|eukprot:EJK60036.1 hypothetical protein THAOC_19686 [Thalassiosira oceanica]
MRWVVTPEDAILPTPPKPASGVRGDDGVYPARPSALYTPTGPLGRSVASFDLKQPLLHRRSSVDFVGSDDGFSATACSDDGFSATPSPMEARGCGAIRLTLGAPWFCSFFLVFVGTLVTVEAWAVLRDLA